jgi:hypothetical protein
MSLKSSYYDESVEAGTKFQKENKSWAGLDTIKYQKQIRDLVVRYDAKTILDYGCGKGLQYTTPLPYESEDRLQTFDEWLGVKVYKYDPCVEQFKELPPKGTKFDGVICNQVLSAIPDDDLGWVAKELESYTDKFCFIGLNFSKPAKAKKMFYDTKFFRDPRDRQFFKRYFNEWKDKNLFWWFKDRMHYDHWIDDQIAGVWKDTPDVWNGKYKFVEKIYK